MKAFLNKLQEMVMITDSAGGVTFCNLKLSDTIGCKNEEIIGKNIKDILFNEYIKYENIKDIIESSKNGNVFTLKISNSKIKNVNIDISEQMIDGNIKFYCILKEINNELYTKKDLERIIDESPIRFAIKDKHGKYIFMNDMLRKSFGFSEDEVLGISDDDIFKTESAVYVRNKDNEIFKNKKGIYDEVYLEMLDGSSNLFETYKTPLFDEEGNVKFITKISKDISLSKKLEEELSNSYNELSKLQGLNENNKVDKYERLNDIQHYILETLNVDAVDILIYDDEKGELVSKYKCGLAKNFNYPYSILKQPKEVFIETTHDHKYIGVKKIQKSEAFANYDELNKVGFKYRAIYKITYNDEFFGLLTILFKEDNDLLYSNKNLIKTVCNQMGMIIKNINLNENLAKEFDKRLLLEKELENFLDTAADIMCIIGDNGEFIKVNNGAVKIFGRPKEELLNLKWQDMIHPDDKEITLLDVEKSRENTNEVRNISNRYIKPNGEVVWLHWGYKYMEDINGLICTAIDVTENKKLEEARQKYEADLHLERIRSEFFSNISHEFKTPLNIIFSSMQLINRGLEKKQLQVSGEFNLMKYCNYITQNSYRLLRLVNNLIDITKIDAGYYKLNLENNNIVNVIEEITVSVANYIEDRGISLVFDTDVEEVICAFDPDKMERIMLNLLSNATKYTNENGNIKVYLKKDYNNIVVSVKNNGIGIPQEKLSGIFERFVQVDNLLTRQSEGSGIGLSLVKSLVELHNGTIEAKSTIGEETEFIFKIPIVKIDDEVKLRLHNRNEKIEKCNIEFSDIYK